MPSLLFTSPSSTGAVGAGATSILTPTPVTPLVSTPGGAGPGSTAAVLGGGSPGPGSTAAVLGGPEGAALYGPGGGGPSGTGGGVAGAIGAIALLTGIFWLLLPYPETADGSLPSDYLPDPPPLPDPEVELPKPEELLTPFVTYYYVWERGPLGSPETGPRPLYHVSGCQVQLAPEDWLDRPGFILRGRLARWGGYQGFFNPRSEHSDNGVVRRRTFTYITRTERNAPFLSQAERKEYDGTRLSILEITAYKEGLSANDLYQELYAPTSVSVDGWNFITSTNLCTSPSMEKEKEMSPGCCTSLKNLLKKIKKNQAEYLTHKIEGEEEVICSEEGEPTIGDFIGDTLDLDEAYKYDGKGIRGLSEQMKALGDMIREVGEHFCEKKCKIIAVPGIIEGAGFFEWPAKTRAVIISTVYETISKSNARRRFNNLSAETNKYYLGYYSFATASTAITSDNGAGATIDYIQTYIPVPKSQELTQLFYQLIPQIKATISILQEEEDE